MRIFARVGGAQRTARPIPRFAGNISAGFHGASQGMGWRNSSQFSTSAGGNGKLSERSDALREPLQCGPVELGEVVEGIPSGRKLCSMLRIYDITQLFPHNWELFAFALTN